MAAGADATPVLHHYDLSPFSEKVRLAFGLKGVAWRSVVIPMTLPKPDYTPLTGGYRRTPAMQIGADVWCDTRLILREIERRWPKPSLLPGASGLHEAVAAWAEGLLFWPAARAATGLNADALPPEFHADRAAMRGLPPPDPERLRRAGEEALAQLRPQLAWVAAALADGRAFLLGERLGLADLAVYHALWFLERFPRNLRAELLPDARVDAWMARIAALGQGSRTEMAAAAALAEAAAHEPVLDRPASGADGSSPGDRVSVTPEERTSPPVVGELAWIDADEVCLLRQEPALGALSVRFPRLGYRVAKA